MMDIIFDTLKDGIRIFPFLWIAFLIIELLEHKFSVKSKSIVLKSGKLGPILGVVLGCFPQCGFSVMATNLYVARVISMGTLISIYLSTSDEMLPILLSHGSSFKEISLLLGIKVVVGIIFGLIIDFFIRKNKEIAIGDFCQNEQCHCENGLIKSSLKHTFHIWGFILLVSFLLNVVMFFGGEKILKIILGNNSLVAPFIASLIGLIPNCAASVVLTELYLSNILSLSSVMAGLLASSGVGILILFRTNKNIKENIKILLLVYLISVFVGLLIELVS